MSFSLLTNINNLFSIDKINSYNIKKIGGNIGDKIMSIGLGID